MSAEEHIRPLQETVDGLATKPPLLPQTFLTFAIDIELHFAEGLQQVLESVAAQGTPAHNAGLLIHVAELALCALHEDPPSGSVQEAAAAKTQVAEFVSSLAMQVAEFALCASHTDPAPVHVLITCPTFPAKTQVAPAVSVRGGLSTNPCMCKEEKYR